VISILHTRIDRESRSNLSKTLFRKWLVSNRLSKKS